MTNNYLIQFPPNHQNRQFRLAQFALARRRATDGRGIPTNRGFTKPQIRRSAWALRP